MDTENTNEQPKTERAIVVRAVYVGKTVNWSRPKEPYFIGSDNPIPLLSACDRSDGKNKPLLYDHNVELLGGMLVKNDDEFRVGIMPGTGFALFEVPISVAESLNGIEDWRFERLSWTKYRIQLDNRYLALKRQRDELVFKMSIGWTRFFGIDSNTAPEPPKVVKLDVRLGKHQKDRDFPSTDSYHYHVNIKPEKVDKLSDIFNAVEYIEQAFFMLGVFAEVELKFDGDLAYRTPEGLGDEKE
jgi:hypothetical protein